MNEENILKYLMQDGQNHIQGKIAIAVSVVLYFMSSSVIVSFFESKYRSYIHNQFPITVNDHISILD